jgi:GH15 family glucan-1,4-alpha-glucosidase
MARIEDYALLGDLQTAALVDRSGSVDWLCFPRFDSGACFAALLGSSDNGRWLLAPTAPATSTRRYLHDTLVLETTWRTEDGSVARVLDFMPPRGKAPDIVRIVEGVKGRVHFRSELTIRFDYGHVVPWVRKRTHEENTRVALAGPNALCFRTPAETRGEDMRTLSELSVDEGERVPFVLTWFPSHEDVPEPIDPEQALADTEGFWREWTERCAVDLPPMYAAVVRRSLIVLKALTYEPTGGIVAAPTTSLPEWIGSVRNWDYRYCWLRDATLTLLAFLQGNHDEEAVAWRRWLLRAVAGDPADIQIMYGVAGERRLTEYEVPWLAGYEGSSPVRIGNAASEQLQLDVYGEVLDALYQARVRGVGIDAQAWKIQLGVLHHLEEAWHAPDEGIWEIRGERRHFVHSKAMAWVAFDRAVRTVEEQGLDGPVDRWRTVRDEIHAEVCERETRLLYAVIRVAGARREPADTPARRVPAGDRPAHSRHDRGGRAGADRGWLRAPLSHARSRCRRPAAGRGGLPALLVLARQLLRAARPARGRGGVRPEGEAASGELPTGIHAPRPRRHRLQRRATPAVADASALRPAAAS